MSFVKTVGRNGIEELYCRQSCSVKEIAKIYDVSTSYLYLCIRQLYGSGWKTLLGNKREEFEVKFYEERLLCAIVY